MDVEFNLEDFFPLYVTEKDSDNFYNIPVEEDEDLFYTSILNKKEFDNERPYFNEPKPLPGEILKHQRFMQRFFSPHTPYDKILIYHGLGTGKCHRKDTPIIMHDGSIKKVQDIKVGELLMGDDSTPRTVLSLASGEDQMYEIRQRNGDNYVVNSEHILCLKSRVDVLLHKKDKQYHVRWINSKLDVRKKFFDTKEEAEEYAKQIRDKNEVVEVSVKDFLEISSYKQTNLRCYKTAIDFPEQKVEIHPYLMGYWIGQKDHTDHTFRIYNDEVVEYMNKVTNESGIKVVKYDERKGRHYKSLYRITNTDEYKSQENIFKKYVNDHKMVNVKRIPSIYKFNTKEVRYQFLAGLIDSCGYIKNKIFYEIIHKDKDFADDIVYLCRSLGLRTCNLFAEYIDKYRIYFNSNDIPVVEIEHIVTDEQRKEVPNQEHSDITSIFTVKKLGVEKYYGFTLDNNCRYLLGDFTVTHNTCLMSAVTEFAMKVNKGDLSLNKITILVRNPNLQKNVMNEIAKVCTNRKYYPTDEEIEKDKMNEDSIRRRVAKLIRNFYEVETFTTFVNSIKELSDSKVKEDYSNRYVLIDEAHNIRVQPVKTEKERKQGKASTSNYNQIHRFLHLVTGCKVMLLTATPMRDKPSEICQIMNLILPLNKQMDRKTFQETYYIENALRADMRLSLKTYFKGIVSYLRSSTSNVLVINDGSPDLRNGIKYTNTTRVRMSSFQSKYYYDAYATEFKGHELEEINEDEPTAESESSKGIYTNTRNSSMLVFPDGTYGIDKIKVLKTDEKDSSGLSTPSYSSKPNTIEYEVEFDEDFEDEEMIVDYEDVNQPWIYEDKKIYRPSRKLIRALEKDGKDVESKLQILKEWSAKFYTVIKDIIDPANKNKKFFIYSNIVTGSGALLFGALLEAFGLEHIPVPSKTTRVTFETIEPKDRYVVLTGSTLDASQTDKIVNGIFNSPLNKYGEYCRIIVGSHVVGEGISFKHIRKMYVLTPFWNSPTTDQAIGRSNRSFSHDDLPPQDRTLTIYRLVAEPVNENVMSIDTHMYKTSEDKDIRIKQIERILKESAVDCALNRERNILESDKPFSKNCDYMEECNYKCDYVNEKYNTVDWVGERIQDTYNLYYARNEIDQVKHIVREMFKYKYAYDFDELYNIIIMKINNLSPIVLARGLNEIIMNNDVIYNKLGFKNFLREDRNLFFLIDNPFLSSIYTSWYYAANPEPVEEFDNFKNVVIYNEFKNIERTIELLEENSSDTSVIDNILNNLSDVTQTLIIETFLIGYYSKNKSGIDPKSLKLQEYIYSKYSNYIQEINNKIYLTIDDDNIKRIENVEQEDGSKQKEWVPVEEEELKLIEEYQKETVKKLKTTNWGYFGYSEGNKFRIKIIEKYLEGQTQDKRKEGRKGIVCGTAYMSLDGLMKLFYDLLSKEKETGVKAPSFEGQIKLTKEEILKNANFNKYLYDYIAMKEVDNDFNKVVDTKLKEEQLPQVNRILFKMYEEKVTSDEKKDLTKFSIPKNATGFNFNKEEMKLFVESIDISKFYLVPTLFKKEIQMYKQERVNKVINGLTQQQIDNLSGILYKKTPDICLELEKWFKANNLVAYS